MSSTSGAASPVLEVEDVHTYYGDITRSRASRSPSRQGEIVTLIGCQRRRQDDHAAHDLGLCIRASAPARSCSTAPTITELAPHEIVELGIAQSPEGRRIFPRMTVLENLEMGAFARNDAADRAKTSSASTSCSRACKERVKQKGGHALRRRAADARDRPGADGAPEAAAARRAVAGPGAGARGHDLRDDRARSTSRASRSCSSSRTRTMALNVAHRGYVLETRQGRPSDDAALTAHRARCRRPTWADGPP